MTEFDQYSGNHASKAKRTREKIALVLFVIICILGLYVITWYFSTATAYNVAATKVDETAGTMESYVTLIYEGTVPREDAETALPARRYVYPSDVRSLYIDKASSVATINLQDLQAEEEPTMLIVNGKKIGFFAIQSYARQTLIDEKIKALYDMKVDVVICICPRTTMLASFDRIDGIICTQQKSPSELSEGYNYSTFIARSPVQGAVGVLTISSSNVFTSSVVDKIS